MQLAQLRAEIAPLFGVSDDVLRVRQQMLYREPELRKLGMTGRRTALRDRALVATAASSALLIVAAMLGKNRETIGSAVVSMWRARCVTPTGNPLEECRTVGALLTLLLQRADVRGRLVFFELDHDIPHLSLVFGDHAIMVSDRPLSVGEWQRRIDSAVEAGTLSRTFYAPYRPEVWKRRVDAAFAAGEVAHISRLPAGTLDKVAALIAAETTGQTGTA